ncbi:MAG TPA: hypothetical protein VK453_25715 [Micromonosporaceae bacterium]|nr:hypothetical protein [Micromonosporaceae bacterium]
MPTDADREMLTYSNATQDQVDQARQRARRKLAEADAHWTPERRAQAHAEYDRRLAAAQ